MFDNLIESNPHHQNVGGIFGSTFMSVVIHTVFIGGAIYATQKAAEQVARALSDTTLMYIEEEKPEEPEPVVKTLEPPPKGFQVLTAPVDIPQELPAIDLAERFDPRDYTGVGLEGGVFSGVQEGTGPVDLTQVFAEAVVDEVPEKISCLPPEYPRMLQQANIEGVVLLQFIVGTDGRAERGSIEVLRADHKAFGASARDGVERCLFRPGRVRGQAVRVLVQMPINFVLGGARL